MSLTTKKDPSSNGSAGQKALNAAAQTASQVVPMAKNAGQAARQGAEAARTWAEPQVRAARDWAEPQVRAARSWAAPRVEQAGVAVRDKIAPTVSAALVDASHRLDGAAQKRQKQQRRWPRMVAVVAMLAAAASAAVAVFLKRQAEVILSPDDQPADGGATAAGQGDGASQGDGATRAAGEPASGQGPATGQSGQDSDDLLP